MIMNFGCWLLGRRFDVGLKLIGRNLKAGTYEEIETQFVSVKRCHE